MPKTMKRKTGKPRKRQNDPAVKQALERAVGFHKAGLLDEAEKVYRDAIKRAPRNADALNLLGVIEYQRNRYTESAKLARKALALQPNLATAHNNLGNALASLKQHNDAEASYRKALELQPDFADAKFNLGCLMHQCGRLNEAEDIFLQTITLDSRNAAAYNNLGLVLSDLGQREEAVRRYQQALEIAPDYADALANIGIALKSSDSLEGAAIYTQRAIAAGSEKTATLKVNLGSIQTELGDVKTGISLFKEALELDRSLASAHSNMLFSLHYIAGLSKDILFKAHREWNAWHAAPIAADPLPAPDRPGKRPLRVGLISQCFRRHPTMWLSIAGLEALDPDTIRLIGYSGTATGMADIFTERLQQACHDWRSIAHLDDAAVAAQIRKDAVDILIDMSGHSQSRLLVCAHRAAPVQVKWVGGQFNTTGMDAMDWILADDMEIPPGEEQWYTERVYRMPDGYIVYDPPADAPDVGPLPAREAGVVTFGCFNNPAKLNDQIMQLWARVLQAVPGSRLFLKGKALGFESARNRTLEMAEKQGITPDRLILEGQSPPRELLDCYNRVDIALDPWPYSGGLTTCEALWMGVPVLTVPGPSFAGRHAASHLNNAGLTDWIVETAEAYVARAAWWAGQRDELAALRAELRDRVAASPLCDGPRFARNLEQALIHMWEEACAGAENTETSPPGPALRDGPDGPPQGERTPPYRSC